VVFRDCSKRRKMNARYTSSVLNSKYGFTHLIGWKVILQNIWDIIRGQNDDAIHWQSMRFSYNNMYVFFLSAMHPPRLVATTKKSHKGHVMMKEKLVDDYNKIWGLSTKTAQSLFSIHLFESHVSGQRKSCSTWRTCSTWRSAVQFSYLVFAVCQPENPIQQFQKLPVSWRRIDAKEN